MLSGEWAVIYRNDFPPAAAANRALCMDGHAKAGLPECDAGRAKAASGRS